jgi:hypothetical protein
VEGLSGDFLYNFGFYMVKHPRPSIDALKFVLTTFFLAEGTTGIAGFFQGRKLAGSSWVLAPNVF